MILSEMFDGRAAQWSIIIAAIGTVILQVIGRLQSWQLAVIAARAEAKQEAATAKLDEDLEAVVESFADLRLEVERLVAETRKGRVDGKAT